MSCDWEGDRRSGVALAMRHRLKWLIHLRAQGLSKGDEHPTNTPHGAYGTLYLLPFECRIRRVCRQRENAERRMIARGWSKRGDNKSGKIVAELVSHRPPSVQLPDPRVPNLSLPPQCLKTAKHQLVKSHVHQCHPQSYDTMRCISVRPTADE